MIRYCLFASGLMVLLGFWSSAPGADKDNANKKNPDKDQNEETSGPSTEPKNLPIEMKLVNLARRPYDVHAGGDRYDIYQEKIRKAEANGKLLPAMPVEMELQITNKGAEPIKIWVSGDTTLLTLDLKGNGARTASVKKSKPTSYIAPETVTIAPGKTHSIPLTALAYGFRNEETHAYMTEPTRYELKATFRTGVFPAPKDSQTLPKGFGEVILKSGSIIFMGVRPS